VRLWEVGQGGRRLRSSLARVEVVNVESAARTSQADADFDYCASLLRLCDSRNSSLRVSADSFCCVWSSVVIWLPCEQTMVEWEQDCVYGCPAQAEVVTRTSGVVTLFSSHLRRRTWTCNLAEKRLAVTCLVMSACGSVYLENIVTMRAMC
jgi:hypothetical protein